MSPIVRIDDSGLRGLERFAADLPDAIARGVNQIGKETGEEVGHFTGHPSGRLAKSFIGRPIKTEGRRTARAKMTLGARGPIYGPFRNSAVASERRTPTTR